ncbi:MAG: acyloxyacyl hydrolase [Phycisphaerales bacterium]|nr:acyloxyacyl hydrolase [Phycisphaerales bacterium]
MRCPILLCIVLAVGASAAADPLDINTSLAFDADAARGAAIEPEPSPAAPAVADAQPVYGKPGPWWGQIGGGYARELDDGQAADDANLTFSFSTFLVDNFEFLTEIAGWYFTQPGDDAMGLNVSLLFRWHFLNFDTWTVFVDGGAGVLVSTDLVPDTGTGFNFTPRAGVGGTIRLGESANRLVLGARWNHISNARIKGEDRNPSRDGIMGYIAIQFPF